MNVILIRLEDWAGSESGLRLKGRSDLADRADNDTSTKRLPNGIEIAQLNTYETDYLYQEIFELTPNSCIYVHGRTG